MLAGADDPNAKRTDGTAIVSQESALEVKKLQADAYVPDLLLHRVFRTNTSRAPFIFTHVSVGYSGMLSKWQST